MNIRSITNNSTSFGYREDASRSSNVIADCADSSLSGAEKGYQRDDSTNLDEVSGEMRVLTYKPGNPVIARKRSEKKTNPSEEETQIIPHSLGYIDHSLYPINDDHPFAPLHRMPNFPETLFAILSNEQLINIISWMPHGRSFTILNRTEFVRIVLPIYYRTSRMSSFTKQLNSYGFTKIKVDVSIYTYYHVFFLRGLPHLVHNVKRNASTKSPTKSTSITEADLERASADAPIPERVLATNDSAAIRRINEQYEVNRLEMESSQQMQHALFPSLLSSSSSNIMASQSNRRPTLPQMNANYPVHAIPQFSLNTPNATTHVGWTGVTNALFQAFQTAQAQRQLSEQVNEARLALLANAVAADLQNTARYSQYPHLTPSQLELSLEPITNTAVPGVSSTAFAPLWSQTTAQLQQSRQQGSHHSTQTQQQHQRTA